MHVSPSADFSLYLASGAERPLPTQTVLRFSDGSAWDGATDLEVVVYGETLTVFGMERVVRSQSVYSYTTCYMQQRGITWWEV